MWHFQHCRRLLPAGSIGVVEKVNLACEAAQLTEFWCQQVLAEHCPSAHEEARFLLVGPEVTSNAAGAKPGWSDTSAP